MSSTLREIQSAFLNNVADRRFWIIFSIIIVLFAIVGPFNSFSYFDLPMRFAYWGTLMVGSWFIAVVFIAIGRGVLDQSQFNTLTITLISALLSAFPIAAFLQVAIGWFITLPNSIGYWYQFKYAVPICLGFAALLHFALEKPKNQSQPDTENPLLKRLPHDKRGKIQHMSMQDHYISVTTNKGTELVLMRMADAVAAMNANDGIQIHRSHWISKSAIAKSVRENGQPFVVTKDGKKLPVSRSFVKVAREAGVI